MNSIGVRCDNVPSFRFARGNDVDLLQFKIVSNMMEKETSIKKYHRDVCAVAVENLGNTLQSEKGVGSFVAHRRCFGTINIGFCCGDVPIFRFASGNVVDLLAIQNRFKHDGDRN